MGAALGRKSREGNSKSGQALVEFALILPLLLVLLLGVADFGRVFQAEIVIESASRAAAEAGAIEYLRTQEVRAVYPGPISDYYEHIHEVASRSACQEARILPNTTYTPGVVGPPSTPASCPTWPAVAVCVHDADTIDPVCDGSPASGYSAGPPECTGMDDPWSNAEDSQGHDYVEVRVCYHFTTLFNLHLSLPFSAGISVGDLYIQRTAVFTVADY